jgi:cell division protein ZapA
VKAAHHIRVLGRELKVRSSASAETVREVEAFVNQRLGEVAASIPAADQQLVMLLTLLNIAESYLAQGKSLPGGGTAFQEKIEHLLIKLDQALE